MVKSGRAAVDMVEGPLLKKILRYSFPVMAANVMQLFFNAADMAVVGRFAGAKSMAAVGSTIFVVNLFLNVLIGMAVGVNVTVGKHMGAGADEERIARIVRTACGLALTGGLFVALLGNLFAPALLDLISTPADVRSQAVLYIRILFAGAPAQALYNSGAAVLRARGDTRRPLYFLLFSGLLNVAANLFFVIALHMDVAGVGIATVLSQALSALLVLRVLAREMGGSVFSPGKLVIERAALAEIVRIGLPAGVQNSLFSISNMAIQGAINSYGSTVVAASSAAFSAESFVYISMNAFADGCQTFTSQNYGARRPDRMRRVMALCQASALACGLTVGLAASLFAGRIIGCYSADPSVIAEGARRLRLMASLYFLYGSADVTMGAFRGAGNVLLPAAINLVETCGLRVLWAAAADVPRIDVYWIYLSYPATWVCLFVTLLAAWFRWSSEDFKL